MAIFPFSRDLAPVLLLLLTAFVWKRHFYMRGLTYRSSVVPVGRERALKSLFYVGLLGVVDAVLRRLGQLLSRLPFFSQVLPRSETTALVLRLLLPLATCPLFRSILTCLVLGIIPPQKKPVVSFWFPFQTSSNRVP